LKFYRLDSKKRTVADAFSGKGGLFAAGRWNSLGGLVVYASESVSLAYLERLAHFDSNNPAEDLHLFEIDIPNGLIEFLTEKSLPKGWDIRPPGPVSRALGDAWLARKQFAALVVPSVIVVQERNALINPLHPKFDLGWVKGPVLFKHDSRLASPADKKKLKK